MLGIVLRISTFSVFFGRSWQHFTADVPYRTLFWNEGLLSPFCQLLGGTWESYLGQTATDGNIQNFTYAMGALYFLLAILSLSNLVSSRFSRFCLLLGSGSLFLLSGLYSFEKGLQLGQFLEHFAQASSPLFLVIFEKNHQFIRDDFWFKFTLRLAISLTFVGHGLYAIGYYPVPGHFVDMVITLVGPRESHALGLLYYAGIMDFSIAILIFIPLINRSFIIFAFCWGAMTSLARPLSFIESEFLLSSANQWMYELVIRLPHALIPLALFLALNTHFEFKYQSLQFKR
jgi:hypothetical protein